MNDKTNRSNLQGHTWPTRGRGRPHVAVAVAVANRAARGELGCMGGMPQTAGTYAYGLCGVYSVQR